jgi:outer membrane autotransporter protein
MGMFNMMNQVGGMYTLHMDGLRSGINTGESGFAFGDADRPKIFWMKGMANYMDQDLRKGVAGYDATTGGTIAGIDWMATDDLRVGWGGGWVTTDIDNDDNAGGTDADSYLGSLYGSYAPSGEAWYVDAVLSAGLNQ